MGNHPALFYWNNTMLEQFLYENNNALSVNQLRVRDIGFGLGASFDEVSDLILNESFVELVMSKDIQKLLKGGYGGESFFYTLYAVSKLDLAESRSENFAKNVAFMVFTAAKPRSSEEAVQDVTYMLDHPVETFERCLTAFGNANDHMFYSSTIDWELPFEQLIKGVYRDQSDTGTFLALPLPEDFVSSYMLSSDKYVLAHLSGGRDFIVSYAGYELAEEAELIGTTIMIPLHELMEQLPELAITLLKDKLLQTGISFDSGMINEDSVDAEEPQDEEGLQALRTIAANGTDLATTIQREPEIQRLALNKKLVQAAKEIAPSMTEINLQPGQAWMFLEWLQGILDDPESSSHDTQYLSALAAIATLSGPYRTSYKPAAFNIASIQFRNGKSVYSTATDPELQTAVTVLSGKAKENITTQIEYVMDMGGDMFKAWAIDVGDEAYEVRAFKGGGWHLLGDAEDYNTRRKLPTKDVLKSLPKGALKAFLKHLKEEGIALSGDGEPAETTTNEAVSLTAFVFGT
jgi:hypothetical protein